MDIDLKVNHLGVSLGMAFDPSGLASAEISKMGFFSKALMPIAKQPGDTLYYAKNPIITCFGERVLSTARVDRNRADMMHGTSAYLFFNSNRLRYVIFQVIANYIAATGFTNSFREVASEVLGKPETLNYTQIPYSVMGITGYEPFHLHYVWVADGQRLLSEIGQSGKNAFVHWQAE
jgi:hypothetical protein